MGWKSGLCSKHMTIVSVVSRLYHSSFMWWYIPYFICVFRHCCKWFVCSIFHIIYCFQALLYLIHVFYISHILLFSGVAVPDLCVLYFTYFVVFRRCCTWFVWWSPLLSLITSLYTSTHKPVQITTQTWPSWNKCTPS